ALIYSVVHSPAPSPRRLKPDLSESFEQIVLGCLQKDPAQRTKTAAEVAQQLKSRTAPAGIAAPTQPIRSIAVMPLANVSGDAAQEFLADGLTDALIASLAGIRALRVISRTSVMTYKNAMKPLPQIARELDVDAIVEGSVLRAGERVRINAHLVKASTDSQM